MFKMKRLTTICLLACLLLGSVTVTTSAANWYDEDIKQLKSINFVPQELFSNYDTAIKREEFCALTIALYEYLNKGAAVELKPAQFTDITNSTYRTQIQKAFSLGIISGTSETTFDPNDNLTREQFAVMIHRLYGKERSDLTHLDDFYLVSDDAADAVDYCMNNNIMNGIQKGVFAPKNTLTKAEALVVIYRLTSYDTMKESKSKNRFQKIYFDYMTQLILDLGDYEFVITEPKIGYNLITIDDERTNNPVCTGYLLNKKTSERKDIEFPTPAYYILGGYNNLIYYYSQNLRAYDGINFTGKVLRKGSINTYNYLTGEIKKVMDWDIDFNRLALPENIYDNKVYIGTNGSLNIFDLESENMDTLPIKAKDGTALDLSYIYVFSDKVVFIREYDGIYKFDLKGRGPVEKIESSDSRYDLTKYEMMNDELYRKHYDKYPLYDCVSNSLLPRIVYKKEAVNALYSRDASQDPEDVMPTDADLQVYIKINEILRAIIKPDMTEFEKVKAIYDYVVLTTRYYRYYKNGERRPCHPFAYETYGALIKHEVVCEGFAWAMHDLLQRIGIEVIFVSGDSDGLGRDGGHAWNIVKIDEKYYHIDATDSWSGAYNTFDRDKNKYRMTGYARFLLSDEEIGKDHYWDGDKYPKCEYKWEDRAFNRVSIPLLDIFI
jgi:hypothetical protein